MSITFLKKVLSSPINIDNYAERTSLFSLFSLLRISSAYTIPFSLLSYINNITPLVLLNMNCYFSNTDFIATAISYAKFTGTAFPIIL